MKYLHVLRQRLSDEQNRKVDEMLERRDALLQNFKALRRRYSNVKSNIKRIEKKLITIMEQMPEDTFRSRHIEHEIARIENKYAAIEKSIKYYKQSQSGFAETMNAFYLINPEAPGSFDHYMREFNNDIRQSDSYIIDATHSIDITKRYFSNITSAFQSHEQMMIHKRAMERRKMLQLQMEEERERQARGQMDCL